MGLVEGILDFSELSKERQTTVIKTLMAMQQCNDNQSTDVLMPQTIVEEGARAKEYFRRAGLIVPRWLFSSVNWKQAYSALLKEGLLVNTEEGMVMRFK